jgi:toxin-antitoxin system PIN domain toxin
MDFLDVNVLVNAFRPDMARHREILQYVQSLIEADQPYAISSVVFSGFLRIVTHPKIFKYPNELKDARKFANQLRAPAHFVPVEPGPRHWEIFLDICDRGKAKGALISDAYLAAMAIEIGAELVTDDRGFGRWPGLRWRHPVDE